MNSKTGNTGHWSYRDKKNYDPDYDYELSNETVAMVMKMTMTNTIKNLANLYAGLTKKNLHEKKPVTLLCLCMCSI